MSKALEKVELYQRGLLAEMLSQCNEFQQGIFARMYPDGAANMSLEKVPWAIEQVERTIQINQKKEQG